MAGKDRVREISRESRAAWRAHQQAKVNKAESEIMREEESERGREANVGEIYVRREKVREREVICRERRKRQGERKLSLRHREERGGEER